jgi:hypothetical protein
LNPRSKKEALSFLQYCPEAAMFSGSYTESGQDGANFNDGLVFSLYSPNGAA